jgi:hypothetical protein
MKLGEVRYTVAAIQNEWALCLKTRKLSDETVPGEVRHNPSR